MSKDLMVKYEIIQNAIIAFGESQHNMVSLEESLDKDVKFILQSDWMGEAANAFATKFEGDTQRKLKDFSELLGNIRSALQQALEDLRNADNNAAEKMGGG